MKTSPRRLLFVILLAVSAGIVPLYATAQDAGSDDVKRRRQQLEAELAKTEADMGEIQGQIDSVQKEKSTLERDIFILDSNIKKANLAIKSRTLRIQQLSGDIGAKEVAIGKLDEKLMREKDSLAQLIRKTNEIDDVSMVEMLLSNERTLSDVFVELDSFDAVTADLQLSFRDIEETKGYRQAEKVSLESKKTEEEELRRLQELERKNIQKAEAEKQSILKTTKGKESEYQKLLKSKEKTAAQIRAELFTLRDSAAIPFGQALDYANSASSKTGVRPALILAILTQETRLGENLGTGSWHVDMHPTRDRPLFLAITATLGYDPERMPVSRKGGLSSWGGAMGPSQFIPSTWSCYGGYINTKTGDCSNSRRSLSWDVFWAGPWEYRAGEDRLRKLLGKNSPADPWQNKDAFMATGLLMKENGADQGTFKTERLAALRYFAGWANATKPQYAIYGDSVMKYAAEYQKQIDILSGS